MTHITFQKWPKSSKGFLFISMLYLKHSFVVLLFYLSCFRRAGSGVWSGLALTGLEHRSLWLRIRKKTQSWSGTDQINEIQNPGCSGGIHHTRLSWGGEEIVPGILYLFDLFFFLFWLLSLPPFSFWNIPNLTDYNLV